MGAADSAGSADRGAEDAAAGADAGRRAAAGDDLDQRGAAEGPRSASGAGGGLVGGVARAAVGIAVVTVAARLVGAARTAVLAQTVGTTCLGDTYSTANAVPNVVFEVVAGGALASLVVPVLAAAVDRGDRDAVGRTCSALLTWTVLLLVPVALAAAVAGPVVMSLLSGSAGPGCDRAAAVEVGARMLVVFAPQVVLYGVGIVLAGVLQAHRRFLGPALAPLLSSLVVIGTYVTYAAIASGDPGLTGLSRTEELVLSVGTTLGVAALTLSLLVPLRRTRIRLTPTVTFPPTVAGRVRRLAAAGLVALAAQQLSVVVVLRLANDGGPPGSVVVYTLASTAFLLPWAVLAVPIATSAFPVLAARAAAGDDAGYDTTAAAALRAVLLVTTGAAGLLVAVAAPAARVLVLTAPGRPSAEPLAAAIAGLGPGLVGYGLLALLTRALYARGANRPAAAATVTGWLVVVAADLVLARVLPADDRVLALALGNTLGMTVAGGLLLGALARSTGALPGAARAGAAGLVAGGLAAAAGLAVATGLGTGGVAASLGHCAAVGVVGITVHLGVLAVLDRDDLTAAGRPLARAVRRRRSRG